MAFERKRGRKVGQQVCENDAAAFPTNRGDKSDDRLPQLAGAVSGGVGKSLLTKRDLLGGALGPVMLEIVLEEVEAAKKAHAFFRVLIGIKTDETFERAATEG